MILFEVCVDSIEGARIALSCPKVERIELCAALSDGGITPSCGTVAVVTRIARELGKKVMVLVRGKIGGFFVSSDEMEAMMEDVSRFRDIGVDGIVVGMLMEGNEHVDVEKMRRICDCAEGMEVTFHRAIDEVADEHLEQVIDEIASIGPRKITRVLSSGGEPSCASSKGLARLKRTKELCSMHGIKVMAGGGVKPENVEIIVKEAHVDEIHGSARQSIPSTGLFPPSPLPSVESINDILEKLELSTKGSM